MSRKNLQTRTRILEAVWKLLESGSSARMADIAKQAGLSRQALYLHFPNRADLLIATTRYLDEVKDVDARLLPSRSATSGPARLNAFIEGWGNYIPEVYGVIKALMAIEDTDEEARNAWNDRMDAVRQGCAAAVAAIERDGLLTAHLTKETATDLLWTLLSPTNWEQLTQRCGWTQDDYIRALKSLAHNALLSEAR